jgi:hypothetical protein
MRIRIIGITLCASALLVNAETAKEAKKRIEQELKNIPVLELPARAAAVVRNTPAADRSQAAIIAVSTVAERHPAAADSVASAISKAAPETKAVASAAATYASHHTDSHQGGSGNGNQNGPGNANGNGHANGGVGLGPGPNKPGRPIVHDRPINSVLPNGKPRHFPPTPPKRPVTPPRPHKYNKPGHH